MKILIKKIEFFLICTSFSLFSMDGVPCFSTETNYSLNAFSLPIAQPKRTSKYAVSVAPAVTTAVTTARPSASSAYDLSLLKDQPKRTSKYAVSVAPDPVLVDIAVKKTIEQHKTDGANGYTIVANADMADHTHDLSGTHTHFPKDRAQALVTAAQITKNNAQTELDSITLQAQALLELIAQLKATHGSTVASAALTHDGTLNGMLNAAKHGAGNITLADSSVVDVAAATNPQLTAILTGANLDDKEALLAALRAAPAWTANANEEADLTKTIFLRSIINR